MYQSLNLMARPSFRSICWIVAAFKGPASYWRQIWGILQAGLGQGSHIPQVVLLKFLSEKFSDSELRVLIQSKDTNAEIGASWDGLNLLGLLNLRMRSVLGRIHKRLYNSKGLPRVDTDR